MRRRHFLQAAGALSAAAAQPPRNTSTMKARALKPGDTVAFITPSTYVSDPDQLLLSQRLIEALGLKVKYGRNVKKKSGYLGGTARERLDDLHEAFTDPEVKGVIALRGGYGAGQLLDGLDLDLIRRHPKVFAGYSDITALHLAIHQKTGLVTFHGPTGLSRFSDFTFEHFKRALFETKPLGRLANPPETRPLRPRHWTRTIRPGQARGPLIGGNLTLISTTMGTPFEIQTEGKLLFLEDVDEQPYSMDRMLTQLRLAGKFKGIKGLLIGECADCAPREFRPSFQNTFTLGEVLDNLVGDLPVPVLSGLVIGHTEDQITLPLGVTASLDAGQGTLTIEESALTE